MSARTTLQGRRPDEEAELDRRIKELTGKGPEGRTPESWAGVREQMRLELLYPGLFVAFRDHHQGKGKRRRLVWREVLCSARTLEKLSERLDQIVPREEPGILVLYVEKPDSLPWM